MRIRILKRLKSQMRDPVARETFSTVLELRQRLFEAEYEKVLCLDRYDLIADHVVLYADEACAKPMAYVRSVSTWDCRAYDVPFPIDGAISHLSEHREAFRQFEAQARDSLTMGFLCLDQDYRRELNGIRIIDLMVWAAFQAAMPLPRETGYCATPNAKFRQNFWLRQIGDFLCELPRFRHPTVPQEHELILIPSIRASYWPERQLKYGRLLREAEWLLPAGEAPAAVQPVKPAA